MKNISQLFFIFFAVVLVTNCKNTLPRNTASETITINALEVDKKELELNPIEAKWYYKGHPFNGYSIKYYPNGTVEERLGFYKGKREGIAKRWSKNGVLRVESFYKNNRLTGTYKSWWENGNLGSQTAYLKGEINGVEKKWYPNGVLAKERQLVNGKEEGMQKAWLQNGALYVNYEAKNGRIFGMKRANSCYQLEDEVVVRSK
ncbi:hypothetical protein [Aurantibacter sp.]|uniref:toxin-antitoxin system YwqK family antitoxin n=1 Tax=Aurantibacter sp. TaxID=2807103 RepID=UPI003262EA3B